MNRDKEIIDRILGEESTEPNELTTTNTIHTIPDNSSSDSPLIFLEYSDCIKIGDKYCQIYSIKGYGRKVFAGYFERIANLPLEMDCFVCLSPIPTSAEVKAINKNLIKIETDILTAEKSGQNALELESKKKDLETLARKLLKNEEHAFDTNFIIRMWSDSKAELNKNKELLTSTLASLNLDFEKLNFRMARAFSNIFHSNTSIASRTMFTRALAMGIPFVTESYPQPKGVPFGFSAKSGLLITLDPFSFPGPHQLILGSTGRGKTTAIELDLIRNLYCGTQSIIIDPASEYSNFVQALGGVVIKDTSNINFNSPIICLDTFGLPDNLRDEHTAQMLNSIKKQSELDRKKRFVCIDEAHLALFHSTNSHLLRELIKTRRKFNTAIVLITQNTADFVANKQVGEQILGNTDTKLLFGFQDSEMRNVAELFALTPEEEKFLRRASIGQALLITPHSRIPIEVIATPKELALIKGISPKTSESSPCWWDKDRTKTPEGGGIRT